MSDKEEITLKVAGLPVTVSVRAGELDKIQQAADEVNHAWESARKRFEGRRKEEILVMVAMLFAQAFNSLREENLRLETVLDEFEKKLDLILDQMNL